MERLTYKKSLSRWDCGKYPTKYTSRHTFQEVVARLAAYEDTGLEPWEIPERMIPLPPVCYKEDGDGCAYQTYDGTDEPIDECKECPLCVVDKQRHREAPNDPLILEELRGMDGEPVWVIFYASYGETVGMWVLVSVDEYTREVFLTNRLGGRSMYEETIVDIKAIYRRKPEEEADNEAD